MVDRRARRLLGRHVLDLALEAADQRLAHAPVRAGDAEVDHLHRALERDQDVLRRDVAMNDVQRLAVGVGVRVRVSERGGGAATMNAASA
jgi:hypothetical protein